jgi:hypothetical protein
MIKVHPLNANFIHLNAKTKVVLENFFTLLNGTNAEKNAKKMEAVLMLKLQDA